VVTGGVVTVVAVGFTVVTAAVVSDLDVAVGVTEVAGDIDDLEEVACMGLTVVGVTKVVEVVMEPVVLDGCEVTVVVGLLDNDFLDGEVAEVTLVGAIEVTDECFEDVGVVTTDVV